jgi:hypothetical protein
MHGPSQYVIPTIREIAPYRFKRERAAGEQKSLRILIL